ncbi:MAG: hypothetical protein R3E50_07385 [Halioglobus sp.]
MMRITENPTEGAAKQRLRDEINRHIEDFLHRGGRIEVLGGRDAGHPDNLFAGRPATAEVLNLLNLASD